MSAKRLTRKERNEYCRSHLQGAVRDIIAASKYWDIRGGYGG